MKKFKKPSYSPFCLHNHTWMLVEQVTPEMRNDKARIVRDCVSKILIRDHPLFAEQNEEPQTRPQEPNLNSQTMDICCEYEFLFELLKFKAKAGDSDAARELAYIAIETVMTLNKLAQTKPEILTAFSRGYNGWPVIRMKRQALTGEEKELFEKLQIGAESAIELDPVTAKWKWDDAGKIADMLLRFMHKVRNEELLNSLFDFGKLGREAKKLPNFDDDSSLDWWNVARRMLLDAYPEPEKVDELNQLVPAGSSKRRSPGRFKQEILDTLKRRFVSFAPNRAYPT